MPAPTFTGKYASLRKLIWKDTLGTRYKPDGEVYINGKWMKYKTEKGFYNAQYKVFSGKMADIDRIETAGVPVEATLTIDWTKGGSYGSQAQATIDYIYVDSQGKHNRTVQSNRTGGYGYDKESSAFADALNASPSFRKLLFDARVKSKKLPYGAQLNPGKATMPYYSRGVGINSLNRVLEALGYEVKYIPTRSDMVSVYLYRLKRRRV